MASQTQFLVPVQLVDPGASSLERSNKELGDHSDQSSHDSPDSDPDDVVEKPQPRTVPSLLARLRAPTASELARKRKCASNPPSGKRRSRGSNSAGEPKTLSLRNAYVNILQSRSLFRIIPCSVEAVGKNCLSRRVALRTTVVLLNILKERGGSRSSNHAIKI